MVPVKPETGPKRLPIAQRLAILLDVFSPWEGMSLSYRQFAAELGGSVTEAAVKKWPHRKKFPADAARLIIEKAQERGIPGVTLEWVLWGDGLGPQKGTKKVPISPDASPVPGLQELHRQMAAQIAAALAEDLSHNDFGQWSSVEVQRTVLWALKDLARRLWVLRFPMSETFKLTDVWAERIGLPVRPPERAPEDSLASTRRADDYSAPTRADSSTGRATDS